MKAREVEKKLKADGWLVLPGKMTSHKHFIHPECPENGKVTVPFHAGDVNA
ncbi:MAG: type II toxin-antitoxin system HicA family toxin [Candidatus Adiutrix sp.]|jgi:predicted RNA binding protein YcfA (HicA-like mRNA interferase family)|nr:type II toxin-antitoxin system HicA family toxin [Candidatus Adiutrix sp.]